MKIGEKVLYEDKEYKVFWVYNNGYIEINKNRFAVVHVPLSDLHVEKEINSTYSRKEDYII